MNLRKVSLVAVLAIAPACGPSIEVESETEGEAEVSAALTAEQCQAQLQQNLSECTSRFREALCTKWMLNPLICVASASATKCKVGYDAAVTACQAGTIKLHRYLLAEGQAQPYHLESPMALPKGRLEHAWTMLANPGKTAQAQVGIHRVIDPRDGRNDWLTIRPGTEGETWLSFVGYSRAAGAPRVPLYRCMATAYDHFVSTDPGCEGKLQQGLLGYVLSAN